MLHILLKKGAVLRLPGYFTLCGSGCGSIFDPVWPCGGATVPCCCVSVTTDDAAFFVTVNVGRWSTIVVGDASLILTVAFDWAFLFGCACCCWGRVEGFVGRAPSCGADVGTTLSSVVLGSEFNLKM